MSYPIPPCLSPDKENTVRAFETHGVGNAVACSLPLNPKREALGNTWLDKQPELIPMGEMVERDHNGI